MRKRKLALITLFMILVMSFSACGGEAGGNGPSPSSGLNAERTPAASESYTIFPALSASSGQSGTASSQTQQSAGPSVTTGTEPSVTLNQTTSAAGTNSGKPTQAPTKTPTKAPTSSPTGGGATVPIQPSDPVDWAPVIDKDGTYHFGIGRKEYKGSLLIDFTDKSGTITLASDFGEYKFENGVLKAFAGGVCADSYNNFSGGGLPGGKYSTAKYVGVRVKNNNPVAAWFHLQGSNIFLGDTGQDVIMAYDDGQAYAAPVEKHTHRWCILLPANFEGNILIPVSRLYNSPDTSGATAWISSRSPWNSLGFHITCADNLSVDFSYVFLTDAALPSVEDYPGYKTSITNPEYSYTDQQRITPFWKSNIMYNECLTMEQSGKDVSGRLLFVPKRIITVVDVALQKEYVAGVDFEWIKGTNQIKWLKGSSIPYYYEGALSGLNQDKTPVSDYPNWDAQGRCRLANVLYCVGAFLYDKQIAVTYEYELSQVKSRGINYTEYQGSRLPRTIAKLNSGKDLNILFYGDSIFAGGDCSSSYGRAPMMPGMDRLISNYLKTRTSGNVRVNNIAVGGWTAENGLAALKPGGYGGKDYSALSGYDLLILSFGMNNASTSPASFKNTTQQIIDAVKANNPGIEVILVSCMCPNPKAAGFYGNQQYFGAVLKELAAQKKYAVVDMFAVHKKILDYKNYSSTTGNNINHPNDWLIRVYAQNILSAMLEFD